MSRASLEYHASLVLLCAAGFKSAAVAAALDAASVSQEAAISKARLVALLTLCSKSQEVSGA